MNFDKEYSRIKNNITNFDFIEQDIKNLFNNNNKKDEIPFYENLSKLLTAPAKRLRPLLGTLFLNCIYGEITKEQKDLLLAVELIHNATLIHDDIIDEAKTRRNRETLNAKFDNNLAVIAGDFLLSIAFEKIINTNSIEVLKLCTDSLKSTCIGEVSQYFSKFQIPTMEKYIEKSKNKTAKLFEIGIIGGVILANGSEEIKNIATDFSRNFGIAFQIRDDLRNILHSQSSSDIEEGIYTAPTIFANEERKIEKNDDILKIIKETKGIEKTKNLMDNYYCKSISAIKKLNDNEYKTAILDIINLLKEDL